MAFKCTQLKNKRFLRERWAEKELLAVNICLSNVSRLSVDMPRGGWIILLCFALAIAGCQTTTVSNKNTTKTFKTVVVDAGHGGKDPGAYRKFGPPEKAATLDVATRLSRKLRESEFNVVMTRTTDTFIPLDERVEIENSTPNSVFVSIHFNDSRRRGIKGFETYYYSPYAAELAQRVQNKLCTIPGAVNRGVHIANFRVIRKARCPAILVECGYLSNRAEGYEAQSADHRELLAEKISQAVLEARYGAGDYRALATSTPAPAATGTPPPAATSTSRSAPTGTSRSAATGTSRRPPPSSLPPPGEGPGGPGLAPSSLGEH
jgi:N-acetylmuramoyl-L-alanine amidase